MIHWTTVPMTTQDDNGQADPIPEGHDADRITALREYRSTGEINRVWLCTAQQLETVDDCSDLGPSVDAIDWTGFPDP